MVELGCEGVLKPGRWLWARALAWMAALMVASVIAYNAVSRGLQMLLSDLSEPPAALRLVAAIAGSLAVLLLYAGAVRLAERRAPVELALRRALPELALGGAIGSVIVAVIVGVLLAAGWAELSRQPAGEIAIALRDSIRSGVLEELLLRLIVFRLLWRAFGIWPAILLTAALFGALHLANPGASLFAALCLAAGEGVAIGLYLTTRRIWAPIGMHAAWNFTQGWVFGAAVSGTGEIAGGPFAMRPADGVPLLLSGGDFGPEASLAALAISLLASAAALRFAWRRGGVAARPAPADTASRNSLAA